MSFGYSVSDALSLVQLAWKLVEGAKKACGEYDDLTREVLHHHGILSHLSSEMENTESAIHKASKSRQKELRNYIRDCESQLLKLDGVLDKYNGLSDEERNARRLWKKVRFGIDGEVQDVPEIRSKIGAYTSAISMSLQLISLGSQGRVEERLRRQGGELDGITQKLNLVVAKLNSETREGSGSIMTDYKDDDKTFWRTLRSELNREGFPSKVFDKHKHVIKAYVKELGQRGAFDETTTSHPVPMPDLDELGELVEENLITNQDQPGDDTRGGLGQLLSQPVSLLLRETDSSNLNSLKSISRTTSKIPTSYVQGITESSQLDPPQMNLEHDFNSSLNKHASPATKDTPDQSGKAKISLKGHTTLSQDSISNRAQVEPVIPKAEEVVSRQPCEPPTSVLPVSPKQERSEQPLGAGPILPGPNNSIHFASTPPIGSDSEGRWILTLVTPNFLDSQCPNNELRCRLHEFRSRFSFEITNAPKSITTTLEQAKLQCAQAYLNEQHFIESVKRLGGVEGLQDLSAGPSDFSTKVEYQFLIYPKSEFDPGCYDDHNLRLVWWPNDVERGVKIQDFQCIFLWIFAWTPFLFEIESPQAQKANEMFLDIFLFQQYYGLLTGKAIGSLSYTPFRILLKDTLKETNELRLLIMDKLTSPFLDLLSRNPDFSKSNLPECQYVLLLYELFETAEWRDLWAKVIENSEEMRSIARII